MADGERALTKMQWGLESVNGTAVAADTRLLGEHQPISPDRTNEVVEEDAGVRAKGVRTRKGEVVGVTDNLRLPDAYFQALPMMFSCGIKGGITPVEQTTTEGDYLWAFSPSYTATNAPDSITLELGDNEVVVEREYLMFEGYRIQIGVPQAQGSAPVLVEGQYFARQNTDAAFTGALSLPSTENINGKLTRFYRDTSWAGVGGTDGGVLIVAIT